jgi:hypothetical protein
MEEVENITVIKQLITKFFNTKQNKKWYEVIHGDSASYFETFHASIRCFKTERESFEVASDIGRPKQQPLEKASVYSKKLFALIDD